MPAGGAPVRQLDAGKVKYTECGGLKAVRDEICAYLQRMHGLTYAPSQIVCSNGGKQSLLQAILALCNPGMRDRHWDKLSEDIGQQVEPDDELTLQQLLDMNITQHIEAIEEVVNGPSAFRSSLFVFLWNYL